jgi:hypothetical protein
MAVAGHFTLHNFDSNSFSCIYCALRCRSLNTSELLGLSAMKSTGILRSYEMLLRSWRDFVERNFEKIAGKLPE